MTTEDNTDRDSSFTLCESVVREPVEIAAALADAEAELAEMLVRLDASARIGTQLVIERDTLRFQLGAETFRANENAKALFEREKLLRQAVALLNEINGPIGRRVAAFLDEELRVLGGVA